MLFLEAKRCKKYKILQKVLDTFDVLLKVQIGQPSKLGEYKTELHVEQVEFTNLK